MESCNPVLREDHGAVRRLVLNAPEAMNVLSTAMLAALQAEIDAVADAPAVRVVILAARGRAFSAGHDIAEMQAARQAPDGGEAAFRALFARCTALMLSLRALPRPVIAEVQGVATAAGCQLVASCDLALAAESARFGVNGIDVGLFCATPMVPVSRALPQRVALEMLLTGEMMPAPRAAEAGLVNRAVPDEELPAATLALARRIAAKHPRAIALGKAAFHAQAEAATLAEAYAIGQEAIVQNLLDPGTAEGMDAFLAKRLADWRP